jgi:hypothetical protein
MAENDLLLFAVTRPSRGPQVAGTGADLESRREMEESWAREIGVDLQEIRLGESRTESTSPQSSTSPTTSGTETQNGGDVTTDTITDTTTTTITDDMKTDS